MINKIVCNAEDLTAIADAVRASNGSTNTYNVPELSAAAVNAIGTGGTGVSIDDTLTIEGAAADAKAVGERFTALSEEIVAYGVTPEMFGAVGDGLTDDTVAIRRCFEVGGHVVMNGTYSISYDGVIDAPNVRTVSGNAKIILTSGATTDNSVLFKLINATLFEGVEFDLNGQNMGFVVMASGERDFTIRNVKMYNLRDQITTSVSCLVHITRTANVTVDNLSFEDIYKRGNDIITDDAGAHNCIYCANYKNGRFINLTFKNVHTVDSEGIYYIEDGAGLYVVNEEANASTYISNINGHNCCKRTVKTQCAGMVVVNGGHIYYDTDDLITGIGINNIENGSTELGKCIIMGVTGINHSPNNPTGNGFAGIISVSDEGVITDCYFECPNRYAILPGHKTKVSNCKFVGNGVFVPKRETMNVKLDIEDCEHIKPQGFGWLFFTIPEAIGSVKVKNCTSRITNDNTIAESDIYERYVIVANEGFDLDVENVSIYNEKQDYDTKGIRISDGNAVMKNIYIQRPSQDSVAVYGKGSLLINGMKMTDFELLNLRAVLIKTEGDVTLLDMEAKTIPSGKYFVISENCTIVDTNLPMEYPYILFSSNVTVQNNTPVERKDLSVPGTLKNIKDGSKVYTLYKGQKYLYDKATDKWILCGADWVSLKSPDGTVYKLTVSNDGTISATKA